MQSDEQFEAALVQAGLSRTDLRRNLERQMIFNRLKMRETSQDAVNGPYYQYQVARICIQAGRYDRALDLIEPLLSKPGDITPGWLRIDPVFSPLRGNARFERLIKTGT
jgi:hypothetical protein